MGLAVDEGVRFAPILTLWVALTLALHGFLWLAGFPTGALAEAVERGAAHVESRGVGEVGDDLIRRAIRTQRDTLPFWTTLALIGDFLAEPLALIVRALAAATVFCALAALVGRPVGHERALAECALAQGFWVFGLAVRIALMVVLGRVDVETSPTLFLPAGAYPAWAWLALGQLDVFAILGWSVLARGAWRRGQVNVGTAIASCVFLALVEASLRIAVAVAIGAGVRLDFGLR